jgi:protein TonB
MKYKNRLLSITLCVSAVLHVGAFLFLTVNSQSRARTPPSPEMLFSLVNIGVLEPEPPPPPEPPVVRLPVALLPPSEELPVENFITAEEIPPAEEALPVEAAAVFQSAVAGPAAVTVRTAVPQSADSDSAAAGAYVRRNYTYIQRRIRDRLEYPSQARRAGIQGVAEISFTIHRDGTVSGVTVAVSSGRESLDQAAVAAVHAAAPFPAPPAPARLAIPVAFRLR